MEWKLWYADWTTFSSEDGSWVEAPARGVAGLITPSHRAGRQIDTADHYVWPSWSGKPYGGDVWGVMDHLLDLGVLDPDEPLTGLAFETLREAGVKFGRTLPTPEWEELYQEMVHDPDFPRKSAHHQRERVP